jgi:hypothetical protein
MDMCCCRCQGKENTITTDRDGTYDRVFVILRVDASPRGEGSPETAVAVLKALWSEADAEAEVERLNRGSHERGSVYCWKAARLERRSAPIGAP